MITLKGEIAVNKTSLTPPLFIKKKKKRCYAKLGSGHVYARYQFWLFDNWILDMSDNVIFYIFIVLL